MEKILIGLERVSKQDTVAAHRARSLLSWYFTHGKLTKKQLEFARRLISRKPPKKEGKKREYFLYAIGDGINIKLGYSCDPKGRKRSLQTACHRRLNLIWKYSVGFSRADAAKAEKKLHRHCKQFRRRGEWFTSDCLASATHFKIKHKKEREQAEEEAAELELVAAAQEKI